MSDPASGSERQAGQRPPGYSLLLIAQDLAQAWPGVAIILAVGWYLAGQAARIDEIARQAAATVRFIEQAEARLRELERGCQSNGRLHSGPRLGEATPGSMQ